MSKHIPQPGKTYDPVSHQWVNAPAEKAQPAPLPEPAAAATAKEK